MKLLIVLLTILSSVIPMKTATTAVTNLLASFGAPGNEPVIAELYTITLVPGQIIAPAPQPALINEGWAKHFAASTDGNFYYIIDEGFSSSFVPPNGQTEIRRVNLSTNTFDAEVAYDVQTLKDGFGVLDDPSISQDPLQGFIWTARGSFADATLPNTLLKLDPVSLAQIATGSLIGVPRMVQSGSDGTRPVVYVADSGTSTTANGGFGAWDGSTMTPLWHVDVVTALGINKSNGPRANPLGLAVDSQGNGYYLGIRDIGGVPFQVNLSVYKATPGGTVGLFADLGTFTSGSAPVDLIYDFGSNALYTRAYNVGSQQTTVYKISVSTAAISSLALAQLGQIDMVLGAQTQTSTSSATLYLIFVSTPSFPASPLWTSIDLPTFTQGPLNTLACQYQSTTQFIPGLGFVAGFDRRDQSFIIQGPDLGAFGDTTDNITAAKCPIGGGGGIIPGACSAVFRYTSADKDITFGGNTWLSNGPRIERDRLVWKTGLDVDSLIVNMSPRSTDTLLNGLPWLSALRGGALDGAVLQLDWAILPDWASPVTGIVTMFGGRVAEVMADRSMATLKVNSHLELLTSPFPRNTFQASCRFTLFDFGCSLNPANFVGFFTVSAILGPNQIQGTFVSGNLMSGTDAYILGRIVFTTGNNTCIGRSVTNYSAGPPNTFTLFAPFPFTIAIGDAFTAWAGCDKTINACQNKFNNLINFGGMPFIPVPETAV